jgi:TRAP-type C4-dicarboxylate transport system permease small subunit
MRRLAKLESGLARVEAVLVALVMAVMFVAGVAQVVIRTAGMRSAGTDEITTLSMAVLVFAGAGLVVYTADNVAIEVLDYLKNERARRALRLVGVCAVGLFAVIFGYYSWDFASRVGLNERTLQLGLPVMISAGSMVVGAVLMFVHTVGSALRLVAGEEGHDAVQERLIVGQTGGIE